jgi:predicted peptidase
MRISIAALLLLSLSCTSAWRAHGELTVFESSQITVDGVRYPFQLLHPPAAFRGPAPLVVFLHGAGERGSDNSKQLTWLPLAMVGDSLRRDYPCFVLALQCPQDEKWVNVAWGDDTPTPMPKDPSRALQAVSSALDRVLAEHDVDRSRVYLTGLSMGGFGAWDLAMRMPDRFAALVPVCGGGDPAEIERLRSLPIWIWHGDKDAAVPVARSRQMADALRAAGIDAIYTELPGVGHDSWRQAYGSEGVFSWMFRQRRLAQ